MKYIIRRSPNNEQFHVVAKAKNGETLNSSEQFPQKQSALKNILSTIKGHNPKDGTLFRVEDTHAEEAIVFKYLNGTLHIERKRQLTNKQLLKSCTN